MSRLRFVPVVVLALGLAIVAGAPDRAAPASDGFPPVAEAETFNALRRRLSDSKAAVEAAHRALLEERYDLADRPLQGATQFRGKPVQEGPRARLAAGTTWDELGAMTPEEILRRGVFPKGYMPLPHPNQPEGGMLFPGSTIDEIKRQTDRDLTRFDLDFDLPEHFLAELPPPIFLVTRPDLGDASHGKLVTLENVDELFGGVLSGKQLAGFKQLLTPFSQQQFNTTADRRSDKPHQGVACFDCHVNGHTNGATSLSGDIRPQENRHRIDTPSLRGVSIQQLFGSQRGLKSLEDFTRFEQRAAYFDGDPVFVREKGENPVERGSRAHFMAAVQSLMDFPPAPKLRVSDGKLDERKASDAEMRGQGLFFGKAQCSNCHLPPYYTDNTMHDLQLQRFFAPSTEGGMLMTGDGSIKTFPLRGIKDSPPYLHDGRLLTLDDTIEFFNLVLETRLTEDEKKDLRAFLLAL
jgi:cytochrome c peroxidase